MPINLQAQHLPNVIHNLRAAKGWRVQDMVNWHRLVKPLRTLESGPADRDLYTLAFDLCTRFCVEYKPAPAASVTETPPKKPNLPNTSEPKVALFVDAPEHLSGVAVTIGEWSRQAALRNLPFAIHTAGSSGLPNAVEFAPMGTLKLHNYAGMNLHVPHVREVMDYMKEAEFDLIHISTPGPVGMLGLLAGRALGLPVTGTYHTDFPRYAVKLSGDPGIESGSWKFMQWFYGQMDAMAAPSEGTRQDLIEHGFDGSRITVVGRGVKTDLFTPNRRSEPLRQSWDPARPHKLLYVGRVSEEKNLDCLVYAFQQLSETRDDAELIVVGDGPYLDTMKAKLNGFPAVFTGRKTGAELREIYASCDLFVFPSETDTFGVVLLEAQASGLPVLVSSRGGAPSAMRDQVTGRVVSPMTPESLHGALQHILDDSSLHQRMRGEARRFAEQHTPEKAFDPFWSFHQRQTGKGVL